MRLACAACERRCARKNKPATTTTATPPRTSRSLKLIRRSGCGTAATCTGGLAVAAARAAVEDGSPVLAVKVPRIGWPSGAGIAGNGAGLGISTVCVAGEPEGTARTVAALDADAVVVGAAFVAVAPGVVPVGAEGATELVDCS